jgi:hypothetical protein
VRFVGSPLKNALFQENLPFRPAEGFNRRNQPRILYHGANVVATGDSALAALAAVLPTPHRSERRPPSRRSK